MQRWSKCEQLFKEVQVAEVGSNYICWLDLDASARKLLHHLSGNSISFVLTLKCSECRLRKGCDAITHTPSSLSTHSILSGNQARLRKPCVKVVFQVHTLQHSINNTFQRRVKNHMYGKVEANLSALTRALKRACLSSIYELLGEPHSISGTHFHIWRRSHFNKILEL